MKSIKDFVEEFEEEWANKYPFPVEGKDILMCPHYRYSSYDESPCRDCLIRALTEREDDLLTEIHLYGFRSDEYNDD